MAIGIMMPWWWCTLKPVPRSNEDQCWRGGWGPAPAAATSRPWTRFCNNVKCAGGAAAAAAASCGETRGKTAEINTRSSLNLWIAARKAEAEHCCLLLQIRNRELEQDRGQRVCRLQTRVRHFWHRYFRKATTTVIIAAFYKSECCTSKLRYLSITLEVADFWKYRCQHYWTLVATVGVAMTTHNRDRVSFVQDQGWGSGGTETERQPRLGTHC